MTPSGATMSYSKSIRHLRNFPEQMQSLFANIERSVYAAEITCGKTNRGCICQHKDRDCSFKSRMFNGGEIFTCKLHSLRILVGEPVKPRFQ